ncbi:hypothetical protein SK128_014306, partial [Halocaridina rubra]
RLNTFRLMLYLSHLFWCSHQVATEGSLANENRLNDQVSDDYVSDSDSWFPIQ